MSNDAILGITGEEPDGLAQEAPQQLAEWTADDVF